jgi:HAE1 family hydrophobic/amphiphilic exporter-1
VIEARFERVPGVSNSNVNGGEEEEMQVIVDPQKLAARHLTIMDVRNALRGQNKDTSAGRIDEGKRSYVIRTLGQFNSPTDVEGVIIARRGGNPVYVRDVGQVQLGYKRPEGMVRRYGTSAIAVNAIRDTGANVLDVMAGLRDATRELNAGPLEDQGLELNQVYDETDYIYSAIGLVQDNILVGGTLTIAVLLLFLRSGRSTLVIGLAIPTSIIGTFLILSLMGRSLNVISLAGLAFAVGMLVDNAVVVLENIYQHYQRGESVLRASVKGAQEVWGAVVASTLTTLAVFLPVLFVQEEAGQLFRDIALAISAAVGLSMIVSITVIPTATAAILRDRTVESSASGADGNGDGHVASNGHASTHRRGARRGPRRGLGAIGRFVRAALLGPFDLFGRGVVATVVAVNDWLQRGWLRRFVTVVVFVGASVVLSYLMMPKVEYLPGGNRNLVIGILLPPPGYNIEMLKELGEQIEEELRPNWEYDRTDPPAPGVPRISDFFYVARGRQLFLGLRSADALRAAELIPVIQRVGSNLPGMFVVAKQSSLFEQGLTAGRTIEVEIVGPDLKKLVAMGGQTLGKVKELMPTAQVRPVPSLDLSAPEIHVDPKWEQAADMGINATDLGYIVDALNDGAYSGDYQLGGDKIDLTILGRTEFAARTQDLASLPVAVPTSEQPVPLEALAWVRLSSGPEQINHRERMRAITIEVSPPPEVALEDAMQMIQREVIEPFRASGALANGTYQINLAGTADKLSATWEALRFNVILALLITYLLMAALFESWLYPFVIILSVPLGAVGGFAGLWLLNLFILQPLDVLTMLGFVILIGTVVNNPILIVHQALNNIREEGMGYVEAVTDSVRTRIRPIFMTTTTTVLGLLPLVLFPGAGSELYRGLGSVMLGGLIVSTVFTLFLVPCLFSLTLQAKLGLLRLFGLGAGQELSNQAAFAGQRSDDDEVAQPESREVPVG